MNKKSSNFKKVSKQKKLKFKNNKSRIGLLSFIVLFGILGIVKLIISFAYVPNLQGNDGEFIPLSPSRIYDNTLNQGQTVSVPVLGLGGVPASNVRAVVVNITAAGPTKAGFLTVYPSGESRPETSSVNFQATAGAIANQISIKVGADGAISIFNVFGSTRTIVDISGYFSSDIGSDGSKFTPLNPFRMVDSAIAEGAIMNFHLAGSNGVPSAGASAVSINITVAGPTKAGFITAYPSDSPRPEASTINFIPGVGAVANQVIVKLSANGDISIYNPFGTSRILIDIAGYYGNIGNRFVALTPARISDSQYSANQTKVIDVFGRGGVPKSHVKAVVINVTAAGPTASGFVNVYPNDTAQPNTSTLNFTKTTGAIANQIVVRVGTDGKIKVFNPLGSTRIILDVSGFYVNNDQLETIPFDATKVMPTAANIALIQTDNDIEYGPSAAQNFDIYESLNQPVASLNNSYTIIWFFGGGWEGGNNSLSGPYDNIARHLAAQYGYTLVAANYRLTPEAPYPAQYQDAIAIVKYLKAHAAELEIDPNKLILAGFSAGADLATMAGHGYNAPEFQPTFVDANVAAQSAKVHRIMTFATPFDKVVWSKNYATNGSSIAGLNKLVGLSGDTTPHYDLYAKLNALQYASRDDPPQYEVFSTTDGVIPYISQAAAIIEIGNRTSLVHQLGGPNGHVAGLDANVPALIEFLQ